MPQQLPRLLRRHRQIDRICDWIDRQAPSAKELEQLEQAAENLFGVVGENA